MSKTKTRAITRALVVIIITSPKRGSVGNPKSIFTLHLFSFTVKHRIQNSACFLAEFLGARRHFVKKNSIIFILFVKQNLETLCVDQQDEV